MITKNIDTLINITQIYEIEISTGAKVAAAGYIVGGGPVGAAAAYGLYKAYQELQKKYNEAKDSMSRQKISEKMKEVKIKIQKTKEVEKK